MLVDSHLFCVPDPFLYLWGKEVASVVALHYVLVGFFTLVWEEWDHYVFLLQGFLSSSQLDAAISAFFEYVERFIHIWGLLSNWVIDGWTNNIPIYIIIVFKNFDLDCLLCDLVFNTFFLKIFENGSDRLLKTCWDIQ